MKEKIFQFSSRKMFENVELSILIFVAGGSTAKMINFIVAENLPIERVI